MPQVEEKPEIVNFAMRLPKRMHRNLMILAGLKGESGHAYVLSILQAHTDSNANALAKAKEVAKSVKN